MAATVELEPIPYDPDELVTGLMPLVRRLARRQTRRCNRSRMAEDLEQDGLAELYRLACEGAYRPDRCTPEAWAWLVIHGNVSRKAFRAEAKHEAHRDVNDADPAARPESGRDWALLARVREAAGRLPSPHRRVIADLYGLGNGYAQTPEQISRNRSAYLWPVERVERVRAEGLEMLRQALGGGES